MEYSTRENDDSLTPPTVLIVDDNPQNLQILGTIMERQGYDVAVAMNGVQALEFVNHDKPDIILLDIMMPEMDGFETCARLKRDPNTKTIPVIFLTARGESKDVLRGFKVGGVDYVTKPFRSAELLARVKTHIELKRAREEIHSLRGIIPICANCKKIRDDKGFWEQVDTYVQEHSDAEFTHSICPQCLTSLYPEVAEKKK